MDGKYYILNESFCLRGYDKLPYALLKRPGNPVSAHTKTNTKITDYHKEACFANFSCYAFFH